MENQGYSNLKSISRIKVADQVFSQLLKQIREGVWPVGSKLPSENVLCKQFKVSRVSVREAIKGMVALGIVETRQGEGSYVKGVNSETCTDNILLPMLFMDPPTLLEIVEYRKVVERGTMELATQYITEEEIHHLEELVESMEKNECDIREFAQIDLEFHISIALATKNNFVIKISNFMYELMSVSMENIIQQLGMKDGRYYHRIIVDSLKTGNHAMAVKAMEDHIEKTVERIKELIASN